MNNISLLLLTKNESENLKEWGSWIYKLKMVNEIIAIDDESTDNTVKILNSLDSPELSVSVFFKKLNNNFSEQRNFGLTKCKNNWILSLDADEIPTEKTINYINKLSLEKGNNYTFKRNIVYLGRTISHGQCLNDLPIKLFNKDEGKFIQPVHEIWDSSAGTIDTNQIILHYSIKSLSDFLQKINFYSSIRAQELLDQKHRPHLWEIILYPKFKFLELYFLRLGFLDGTAGIIFCLAISFNSFLVRSKLWHLSQK
ncbi:MAG: glycosyltransferase family 2 protein [Candidatus Shapirobacteria bacterium]